jgi:hypothetical protein
VLLNRDEVSAARERTVAATREALGPVQ